MKKFNKKGFTLIEMLVVIAVIAILVSIVIPTVTNSTEKANEAADAANIRSIVAEMTTNALANGKAPANQEYTLKQVGAWETVTSIGGVNMAQLPTTDTATSHTTIVISCTAEGVISIAPKA